MKNTAPTTSTAPMVAIGITGRCVKERFRAAAWERAALSGGAAALGLEFPHHFERFFIFRIRFQNLAQCVARGFHLAFFHECARIAQHRASAIRLLGQHVQVLDLSASSAFSASIARACE